MKKSIGTTMFPLAAPVWVVGTYDAQGKANVMTASWAGICCSKPPCVMVSLRKATYSYANIVARQAFTICVPSEQYVKTADYWGIASGRDVDKFAKAELTAVASDLVDAPYVKEFPLVMECRVRHTIEIGSHTQFIGEVLDIKGEEDLLGPAGSLDVEKLRLFVFLKDYYRGIGAYLGRAFSIGKEK
jgi:flavin reductase (DIM6/NTAB) family NADH-FMN oxidoreductase RutF